MQRLAATGRVDEEEIAAELERDRTAAGERHAASARAARPTAEAKAEAWASVVESDKLPNALQEAVIGGFVQTDQRELLAPYTEKYFAAVKDVWDSRSHEMAQQIAVGLYPALQVSQETLDATDAWLASAQPSAALRRLMSRVAGGRGARAEGPGGGRGGGHRVGGRTGRGPSPPGAPPSSVVTPGGPGASARPRAAGDGRPARGTPWERRWKPPGGRAPVRSRPPGGVVRSAQPLTRSKRRASSAAPASVRRAVQAHPGHAAVGEGVEPYVGDHGLGVQDEAVQGVGLEPGAGEDLEPLAARRRRGPGGRSSRRSCP